MASIGGISPMLVPREGFEPPKVYDRLIYSQVHLARLCQRDSFIEISYHFRGVSQSENPGVFFVMTPTIAKCYPGVNTLRGITPIRGSSWCPWWELNPHSL